MTKAFSMRLLVCASLLAGFSAVPVIAEENNHQGMAGQHDPHAAHRAAMQKPRYAVSDARYDIPDVELLDTAGDAVSLRSILDGDAPVAVNFIFTTCTTICPVMTATFSQMRRALGDRAGDIAMVSISIDPEYDRPAVLKTYAEQFGAGPGWTFLTGESLDIERVLRSFDAYAGSKLNHRPLTFLKRPGEADWVRIDGLASGESLAQEVTAKLLN
jgi:protein SCO1/2